MVLPQAISEEDVTDASSLVLATMRAENHLSARCDLEDARHERCTLPRPRRECQLRKRQVGADRRFSSRASRVMRKRPCCAASAFFCVESARFLPEARLLCLDLVGSGVAPQFIGEHHRFGHFPH